jgi:phage baseplate assembly protein W
MSNDFNGLAYPIIKDANGYFRNQSDINQIKSDLLILLLTNPGERVMLPNFGTPLRRLIFEQNDATLRSQAKQMIVNSISQWEPRVSIDQIEVSSSIDTSVLSPNDNLSEAAAILSISIRFLDPGNIQSVQELVLDVPLGGSA